MNAAAPLAHAVRGATSRDLVGAGLLVLAWVFFTAEMVLVRILSADLSIAQIGIVRTAVQALILLPLVAVSAGRVLKTERLRLHVARSTLSQGGMLLYYASFSLLPLALATTLTFTQASFLTLLAAIFLGETIGWRRISAVVLGFLGVLVVMRPGTANFEPAMLIPLVGAAVAACLMILTRSLSQTDGRATIMAYASFFGLIWMALPAALTWQPVAAEHVPLLAVLALSGTMGQFLFVWAFQVAEASVLAPVDYVRLIFAVAAGYIMFAELPDIWTYVGSAIVCASVAVIMWRTPAQSAAKGAEVPPPGAPRRGPNDGSHPDTSQPDRRRLP